MTHQSIVEFEFSNLDLQGKGFPQTMQDNNEELLFDFITNNVDENQVDSQPNGVFKVSARTSYRKYEGGIHAGQFWTVHEGDILAIRTPSVFDNLRIKEAAKTLSETVDDALEVQADLTQRVSDGEDKQEILEGALNSTLETLGELEDTVDDAIIAQNGIKTEIESLENKIEALEGTVLDAKYTLSSRAAPRSGEFQLYNTGIPTTVWGRNNHYLAS